MPPPPPRRFVLGITGASGAAYALRTLECLLVANCEVHLVVSDYGRRLLADETGIRHLDLQSLLPHLFSSDTPNTTNTTTALPPPGLRPRPANTPPWSLDATAPRCIIHPNKDVGAIIASGSFLHQGMAVLPCSSTTLGSIATGSGSNLLCRAAMVSLKERRPLIICHRETPLTLIDIENMRTLTLAGSTVCPTNPGLYLQPKCVEDIVDFIAGKVLDLLDVEHGLETRWGPPPHRGGAF